MNIFRLFRNVLLASSLLSYVYSTPTTIPPTTVPPTVPVKVAVPPNCMIVLPPFPLSYVGLITPYQLQTIDPAAPCDMRTFPAFAEAVILDLDTNSLSVYHPLIINTGSMPLVPPIQFSMPKNALVGIWFGSNGMSISLTPLTSIQQGLCIYNIGGVTSQDTFGQFAHCNGAAFFETIKQLIFKNVPFNPPVPPLGMASDGESCLTTRDFTLVDMDPSDNVITMYLVDMATGKTAQNSVNNQAANPNAVVLKNGSDNLLLTNLDKIMGCKPFLVPNLADLNNPVTGGKTSAMALDEIHAALRQEKFYAYLPKADPMVRINNMPSLSKLNAYRQGVFQPMLNELGMAGTIEFCAHMTNIQLPRLQKNKQLFIVQPSPDMAISPNLYGFLMNRFSGSYNGINCPALLDVPNPVNLVMVNNLVTDAMVTYVPPIATGPNDPYLLSWDEYPAFMPPTQPPSPSPTPPTTPEPTTTPSSTPSPTPAQNINNVDTTPGKNTLIIVISCASAGFMIGIFVVYKYYNNNKNTNHIKEKEIRVPLTSPSPPIPDVVYVDIEGERERQEKKYKRQFQLSPLSPTIRVPRSPRV